MGGEGLRKKNFLMLIPTNIAQYSREILLFFQRYLSPARTHTHTHTYTHTPLILTVYAFAILPREIRAILPRNSLSLSEVSLSCVRTHIHTCAFFSYTHTTRIHTHTHTFPHTHTPHAYTHTHTRLSHTHTPHAYIHTHTHFSSLYMRTHSFLCVAVLPLCCSVQRIFSSCAHIFASTHCNTLQCTTYCTHTQRPLSLICAQLSFTLQHTAIQCNTLQHNAPHCNTLQHTATHCNTP